MVRLQAYFKPQTKEETLGMHLVVRPFQLIELFNSFLNNGMQLVGGHKYEFVFV